MFHVPAHKASKPRKFVAAPAADWAFALKYADVIGSYINLANEARARGFNVIAKNYHLIAVGLVPKKLYVAGVDRGVALFMEAELENVVWN